jgi:prepilin-type N-terminal cleavage/methylation domain-containing protein
LIREEEPTVMVGCAKRLKALGKAMKRGQLGFGLVEVLIAVAVLSSVGIVISKGLSVSSRASLIDQERTIAENLSQAQLEYVQSSDYDDINSPPQYYVGIPIPSGYSLSIAAERLDIRGDGIQNDDGLQKITVEVYHGDKALLTAEGYKVNYE